MSTPSKISGSEILVCEAADSSVRVDVRLEQDTVWLTQRQVSDLFETTPENVVMHLKNAFADGELDEAATAKDFLVVQTDGKRKLRRNTKHYSLDAVISVGYRVNSRRGVRFRRATTTLREHLVRGYTLNRPRLEQNARERIGSFLFVEFPHRNGRLTRGGEPVINDVGLAALALLVAESAPKDKEVMIRLVMNMLAGPTASAGYLNPS